MKSKVCKRGEKRDRMDSRLLLCFWVCRLDCEERISVSKNTGGDENKNEKICKDWRERQCVNERKRKKWEVKGCKP